MRHDRKGFVLESGALDGEQDLRPTYDGDGSSLSGKERNHLFLSNYPHAEQFFDVSGVSGLDSPADGRAFGLFDFDHDGWLDVAVANANTPLLEVYRNQVGQRAESTGHVVALRLRGGNQTAQPTTEWSNRDGYGALVTVEAGGRTLVREHRCGEGFSAQNSSTMIIGVGSAETIEKVTVRWPSGQVHETSGVPAGTLLMAFENPEHDGGNHFVRAPYLAPVGDFQRPAPAAAETRITLTEADAPSTLRMYTTMTTHCQSCRKEMPELRHVRGSFGSDLLAMYGVPMERESDKALQKFVKVTEAPYELLTSLPTTDTETVREHVIGTLGEDATPATIVTDAKGNVLLTRWGAPSVSELRRLLAE